MSKIHEEQGYQLLEVIDDFNQFLTKLIYTKLEQFNFSESLKETAKKNNTYEIEKYIKKGGTMAGYKVEDKALRDVLKQELTEDGIPFIESVMCGKSIIAICDEESTHIKYQEALNRAKICIGNYYQEMDIPKMADVFVNSQLDKDQKNFFMFEGMEEPEAYILRNKCNDITKGFMVGTEKTPDGKMTVAVHSAKCVKLEDCNKEGVGVYSRDLCRAMLATAFSCYGPNREKNIEQIKKDEELNKKIVDFVPTDENPVLYVTGDGMDKNKRIAITKEGFFESRFNEETQSWDVTNRFLKHDVDEIQYKKELQVALSGIFNEVTFTNEYELNNHTKGVETKHTERPVKTYEEEQRSRAETTAVNRIDRTVKEYMASNPYFKQLPEEQLFNEYRKNVCELFEGIETGRGVAWLPKEKMQALTKKLQAINFDVEEYKAGIEKVMKETPMEKKHAEQVKAEYQKRAKQRTQEKKKEKRREREGELELALA